MKRVTNGTRLFMSLKNTWHIYTNISSKVPLAILLVMFMFLCVYPPTAVPCGTDESKLVSDAMQQNEKPQVNSRKLAETIPEPTPIWENSIDIDKTYLSGNDDYMRDSRGTALAETSIPNNFIVGGGVKVWSPEPENDWLWDWWVGRYNGSTHIMEWFWTEGGTDNDRARAVGWGPNTAIVGGYRTYGAGRDYTLRHFNPDGGLRWDKSYNGGDDICFSVIFCENGDIVSAGYTQQPGYDFWVMRHAFNGTRLWEYRYGGNFYEEPSSIIECANGDLVVTGTTDSYGSTPPNLWLLRLSSYGTSLWNRTYGGTGWDKGLDVVECSNGDLAIAGYTESLGPVGRNFWLMRTNSTGHDLWNRTYSFTTSQSASSLVECSDGGFAIVGTTDYNNGNLWFVRTNSTGHHLWNYTYGYIGPEFVESEAALVKCQDGGFAIAATRELPGHDEDVWLLRLPDPPRWVKEPEDQVIEYGTTFIYDLNATGDYIEGWNVNDTRFSIDEYGVLAAPSKLPIGNYVLEVRVNGSYDYDLIDEFLVTVQDTINPIWLTTPSNQLVEFGDDFSYALSAYDVSGIDSWTINNTDLFSVSDVGYLTSDAPLDLGVYYLQILAYDPYGHQCEATISITVEDRTPPSWVGILSNRHVEYPGEFRYDLNVTDLSGLDTWWINYTSHFQIDDFGVITNSTFLSIGTYTIQVFVNDTQGNILTGSFTVTVSEGGPPIWIINPTDQFVEFNHDFRYRLQAYDASGIGTWWVNDTLRFTISGTGFVTNVTPLIVGTYGLQVFVGDIWGNTISTEFTITVHDTTAPEWIVTPEDQTFEEGASVNSQFYAWDFSGVSHWNTNNTIMFAI
ncbi:MAG: hypothetical protein RTU92_04030, partial [Candidatus Thorarchaeota archaeon]